MFSHVFNLCVHHWCDVIIPFDLPVSFTSFTSFTQQLCFEFSNSRNHQNAHLHIVLTFYDFLVSISVLIQGIFRLINVGYMSEHQNLTDTTAYDAIDDGNLHSEALFYD